MRLRIEFSAEAERDFALIFDHLFESYLGFGESVEAALDHCEARIRDIRQEVDRLAAAPFRGESHDDLLPGLRHLTIGRAIYWLDVNEAEQRVRVLAIFFGSQDHVRHMLTRLLTP
jgi:toxin ParE1/3/4